MNWAQVSLVLIQGVDIKQLNVWHRKLLARKKNQDETSPHTSILMRVAEWQCNHHVLSVFLFYELNVAALNLEDLI